MSDPDVAEFPTVYEPELIETVYILGGCPEVRDSTSFATTAIASHLCRVIYTYIL